MVPVTRRSPVRTPFTLTVDAKTFVLVERTIGTCLSGSMYLTVNLVRQHGKTFAYKVKL